MSKIARSPRLHALVTRLGEVAALDPPARALGKAVRDAIPKGGVKDALSGVPLGHAVHPLLTQVVVGAWTSATVLDVVGGRASGPAARRLIAVGMAASAPTVATGLNDWADTEATHDEVRRVGAVHGALNTAALGLYAGSLAARRRGATGRGVALGFAGLAALAASGHLGGHLAYADAVGVDQTAWGTEVAEWTDVAAEADVPPAGMLGARAGTTAIVLARHDGALHALAGRCAHRGGALHEGELSGGCVQCPLHGSRFRLDDGSVERGPAAYPQPTYDVRVRVGRVEVRSR
jgi:nitrite reductase/ring-hydroxylating ferredoxin subunit